MAAASCCGMDAAVGAQLDSTFSRSRGLPPFQIRKLFGVTTCRACSRRSSAVPARQIRSPSQPDSDGGARRRSRRVPSVGGGLRRRAAFSSSRLRRAGAARAAGGGGSGASGLPSTCLDPVRSANASGGRSPAAAPPRPPPLPRPPAAVRRCPSGARRRLCLYEPACRARYRLCQNRKPGPLHVFSFKSRPDVTRLLVPCLAAGFSTCSILFRVSEPDDHFGRETLVDRSSPWAPFSDAPVAPGWLARTPDRVARRGGVAGHGSPSLLTLVHSGARRPPAHRKRSGRCGWTTRAWGAHLHAADSRKAHHEAGHNDRRPGPTW